MKKWKLIYYPCGNVLQLFDMENDPTESHDLAGKPEMKETVKRLSQILMENMHGLDQNWIKEGQLVGFKSPEKFVPKSDFGLYNQRGYHWPEPKGYSNIGKNA